MGRPRSFDRDAALECAMRLFWERGYAGTSIADLTAAMGIAPPSLYAAFGDKRALFDAVVEHYQCQPVAVMSALTESGTARESIERMLRTAAEHYSRPDTPRGCMLVSEPILADLRAVARAAVQRRIEAGAAAGELADGADVAALSDYVVAVIYGMSAQARDGATREALEGVAQNAMAAWPAALEA